MQTPQFNIFVLLLLYHVCIAPSLKLLTSLLCGSQDTTAVAHQVLPFVTATDGASVCACPCHVFYRNEHINKLKGGARMLRIGQDDVNPHLLAGFQKHTRSHSYNNSSGTTAVQKAPALQTLVFVTATVLLCSHVCAVFTRKYLYIHSIISHLFPRTSLKSNTCRRTSSCRIAVVYQVQQCLRVNRDVRS